MSVIVKVMKFIFWISNMVVVRKLNKFRLCFDFFYLIKGIIRNYYFIFIVKDIVFEFIKVKVFFVVDVKELFL